MRAIVLEKFGGLDSLVYKDIPAPEPKAGHVVIEIKAFGINHAEMHMRRGEWAEADQVSGIECVGLVKSCPGGEFPIGAKVAALMGGLGRTINGSYAEYTRAPASNVALIELDLPWAELATIPETYATAWTCLFAILRFKSGNCWSFAVRLRHSDKPRSRCRLMLVLALSPRHAAAIASPCWRSWVPNAVKSSVAICRSTSSKRERSMQCLTWSATPSCWIRSPCFVAAAALASRAGSVVLIPSTTSIRCCRWRAAFI
jgi:hypothetical protein